MSDASEATVKAIKPDLLTPAEMEQKMEAVAVTKAGLPLSKQIVLAMLSGVFISLGASFFTLVYSDASLSFAAQRVLGGFMFCLGLYLVIVAGAELFTGNNLLVAAAASKKISWGAVFRNWGIVWVGNLLGSLVGVTLIFMTNLGALAPDMAIADAFVRIASSKANLDIAPMFFKGIMCNFLVCLAVWLTYAGRTLIDKLFALLLPISAFVAMGFEHSVANMFFLPMGYVTKLSGRFSSNLSAEVLDKLDLSGILLNLTVVTLGNIVGGAILVGLVYWFIYHQKAEKK